MKVLHLKINQQLDIEPTCAAFGFFDGMHLGHIELINKVTEIADKNNLKKALVTFSEHPKSFIKNESFRYLSTLNDKIELLEIHQFDYLIIIDFDTAVVSLKPLEFIEQYIIKQNIKEVVCGFDYHFGYLGQGNYQTLLANAHDDYSVIVCDKKQLDNTKIASSWIRELLGMGNVELVSKLLNRPYKITGEVIYGKQIGSSKLGFPTANINYLNYVLPKVGVYGVKVIVKGKEYLGMASVGYTPTIEVLDKQSLEVNIFDFDQDIYGEDISILFYCYVRDEVKFSGIEALIEALNNDKKRVKEYFEA